MKKYIIFTFTLLFTFIIYSQNKSFIVTYAVGTSNTKFIKKTKKIKILKDIEYQLKSNSKASSFKIIDKKSTAFSSNIKVVRLGGKDDIYYRNIKEKESIRYINSFFNKGPTLIKEPFNKYNWKLTKTSKKIGNYLCFKAVAEDKFIGVSSGKYYTNTIVAWYAPKIPISVGPSNYCGLPGLVLEVSNKGKHFIVNKIEIKDQDITIEKPKAKHQLTEKQAESFIMGFINKNRKKQLIH